MFSSNPGGRTVLSSVCFFFFFNKTEFPLFKKGSIGYCVFEGGNTTLKMWGIEKWIVAENDAATALY